MKRNAKRELEYARLNAEGKLTFSEKFIYALGRCNEGLTYCVISTYFLFYLTDIAFIDPVAASLIVLAPRIWDGINNPIMGVITDRTRTKWGRRKPYIIGAAIPIVLFFTCMWLPVSIGNMTLRSLYYAFMFFMFATASTMAMVPYYSLGLEMTTDYNERASISNYREVIGMVFSLIGSVAPALLLGLWDDPKVGFVWLSLIIGVVSAVCLLLVGFKCKERTVVEASEPIHSIKEMLLPLLQNKQFLNVTVIYCAYKWGCMVMESFQIYYMTYFAKRADLLPIAMLLACVGWGIALPIYTKLIAKLGKRTSHLISQFWWVAASLIILLFNSNTPIWLILANQVLIGMGWGASHPCPPAMLADVADLDELTTGQRREGLLYGTWSLFGTITGAVAMAPVMWVLAQSGYVAGAAEQAPSVVKTIQYIVALGSTFGVVIGIIFTFRYNITRKRHDEIRRQIDERLAANIEPEKELPMIERYHIAAGSLPILQQIVTMSGGSSNEQPTGEVDIEKGRAGLEALGALAKPRDNVTVREVTIGNMSGEELVPTDVVAGHAILYLHGGAYLFGSPFSHRDIAAALASETQMKVVTPAYRLAPENQFPAALDDAVEAYQWLLQSGYCPSGISIAGDSAGGGLALATVLRLKELAIPLPASIEVFSPWTKVDATTEELIERYKGQDVTHNDLWYKAKLYAGETPLTNPLISPVYGDFKGCPPTLIQVGGDERLLEDSTQMYEVLRRAGVDVKLQIWEGGVHVFQAFSSMLPEGAQAIALAGTFIKNKANLGKEIVS